jgi:hypothetical protein
MGTRSLAVLSFVGVLGVGSVANADGWKGPISQWLNSNNQNSSNATVQNNTTLPNGDNRSVPVPGTLALFAGGFGLFAAWHRRTRQ